jgi:hypothetical protein
VDADDSNFTFQTSLGLRVLGIRSVESCTEGFFQYKMVVPLTFLDISVRIQH